MYEGRETVDTMHRTVRSCGSLSLFVLVQIHRLNGSSSRYVALANRRFGRDTNEILPISNPRRDPENLGAFLYTSVRFEQRGIYGTGGTKVYCWMHCMRRLLTTNQRDPRVVLSSFPSSQNKITIITIEVEVYDSHCSRRAGVNSFLL
jgi:hypothetical protein